MTLKKDKDAIKEEVLENMRNNGTMNALQSLYISKIAAIIKDSDTLNSLKPYKTFRTDKAYIIASQIVIQYLQKKSLDNSLQTISDESEDAINFSNSNLVADTLNIHSDGIWLTDLLNDWNSSKMNYLSNNKSLFFKRLQERLDDVLPENEKYERKNEDQIPEDNLLPNKTDFLAQSAKTNAAKKTTEKQEEFSKSAKPALGQPPNNDKEPSKSEKSQESDNVFSNSDDIADIPVINSDSGDNKNNSSKEADVSINNDNISSQDDKDIDIDIDNESASEGISKSNPTNDTTNNADKNKESAPVETVGISDGNSDLTIDVDSNLSSDSFVSSTKQSTVSKPSGQSPKPQSSFASPSISSTPNKNIPSPNKESIPKPVTPATIEDEVDDFDEDFDSFVVDQSSQKKTPQKQESKAESPQKQTTQPTVEANNGDFEDDDWDDADIDLSNSQTDLSPKQQKQEIKASSPPKPNKPQSIKDDSGEFDDIDDIPDVMDVDQPTTQPDLTSSQNKQSPQKQASATNSTVEDVDFDSFSDTELDLGDD
ncbi:hypothetical protein M9Y10_009385 [Tritrichomonas musculus]|uniref:LisH domain-containing protein n=1 Tax=Tritrichomonas musculus TaxID=1915356 RepID=A0ABR2IQ21_9EUKA